MAGLQNGAPTPQSITVHKQSRVLEVGFSDGASFRIPFELMRVYSPSAEVQGHGPGQEILQTGKRNVGLLELEPVGNYAVKPVFTDGHERHLFLDAALRTRLAAGGALGPVRAAPVGSRCRPRCADGDPGRRQPCLQQPLS